MIKDAICFEMVCIPSTKVWQRISLSWEVLQCQTDRPDFSGDYLKAAVLKFTPKLQVRLFSDSPFNIQLESVIYPNSIKIILPVASTHSCPSDAGIHIKADIHPIESHPYHDQEHLYIKCIIAHEKNL